MTNGIARMVAFDNYTRFSSIERLFVHVNHADYTIESIHQSLRVCHDNAHRVFRIRIITRRCVSELFVIKQLLVLDGHRNHTVFALNVKEVGTLRRHTRNGRASIEPGNLGTSNMARIFVDVMVLEQDHTRLREQTIVGIFLDTYRKDRILPNTTIRGIAMGNAERLRIVTTVRSRTVNDDFRLFVDILNIDNHIGSVIQACTIILA